VSDIELLDRWREGDVKAGNLLFDRHFRALYRFFRNKVGDGIDDLVQQTFLACVEGSERFQKQASFRTYMYAAARNILYRSIEHRQRDAARFDYEVSSVVDLGTGPDTLVGRCGEHRLLLMALRRIPLDFQIALELYYWEGLKGPQLAAALEIPEATVRSRLRRGLEHLRRQLEQLEASPELFTSTVDNLDAWAHELRAVVQPAG
jgi:RNA polymerase sigma factor (sigma-70 family)